jgi:hypothetical protein
VLDLGLTTPDLKNKLVTKCYKGFRTWADPLIEKLHNEELCNMYCSRSTIRVIKSRRIRCTGHKARMGRIGIDVGYRSGIEK